MKTKIEIGIQVKGNNGTGTITKIITKSTGYVEVTYTNGKVKKEMAFNLRSVEGEELKSKPAGKSEAEKLHDKLSVTAHSNGFFVCEDGTTDYEKMNDFLEQREKDAHNSISW